MVRRAAIDVGTNSVRLLVADVLDAARAFPRVRPVLRHLAITRLGEGLIPGGRLRPTAVARTAAVVHRCVALARHAGAPHPVIVGTFALRAARNPQVFLSRLGLPLRILHGNEEARLGYDGVLAGLTFRRPLHLLVVDIGGGSVELTSGRGNRIVAARSLPAGAVLLTERFLKHDPPRSEELAAVRRHLGRVVDRQIETLLGDSRIPVRQRSGGRARALRVIGVGGTITTMAAIVQRLRLYDPNRVHGFRLSREDVARVTGTLAATPLAARRRLPGLQPERADIIVAGALVLAYLLERIGVREITVSEADLLWALVLEQTPIGRHGRHPITRVVGP